MAIAFHVKEENTMLNALSSTINRRAFAFIRPLRNRKGFGTLEVVIIIAVILSIALLFRKTLSEYATHMINTVFAGDPLAN